MIRAALVALLAAQPAQAAQFYFCWIGANGYSMTGQMSVAPDALRKDLVTAPDVTEFAITGYYNDTPIGGWNLQDLTGDTTWVLHFDPAAGTFLAGDALPSGYSQGWNADGTATDCGAGGFGFNSGNFAQDFCLDGQWIAESGVPPQTPFTAGPAPFGPACRSQTPLS